MCVCVCVCRKERETKVCVCVMCLVFSGVVETKAHLLASRPLLHRRSVTIAGFCFGPGDFLRWLVIHDGLLEILHGFGCFCCIYVCIC